MSAPDHSADVTQWEGPLFVAGTWRSGTSLLYALLNKHPQIALLYEGDLLLLKPLFWTRGASGWLARWNFWNKAVDRHQLDVVQIPPTVSQVETAMEITCKNYALQKGARIWGDKVVNFYDSLVSLSKFFPEARFVVIWREPAAIFRSIMRAAQGRSWFGQRAGMRLRFLMAHRDLREQCDRLLRQGTRVHEIHYELLVTDPQGTMTGICKFLDLPFFSGLACLEGADQSAISEGAHHSMVKGGKIVSSLERPDIVPPHVRRKIDRYVSLWQEQTEGQWPVAWSPGVGHSAKPSLLERTVDRCTYRCLRVLDALTVLLYCYAPLRLLEKFRNIRHRRIASIAKPRERSA